MTHHSPISIAVLAAVALALAGCAGTTSTGPEGPDPVGSEAAPPADPGTATPSSDAAEGPEEGTPGALFGVVGTDADPDAYAISLTDESGAPVTTLPAGDYTLTIEDPSEIHNFRLSGEGFDVASEVGAVVELEFDITLVEGTYEFVCDPHPGTMRGEVEVTG